MRPSASGPHVHGISVLFAVLTLPGVTEAEFREWRADLLDLENLNDYQKQLADLCGTYDPSRRPNNYSYSASRGFETVELVALEIPVKHMYECWFASNQKALEKSSKKVVKVFGRQEPSSARLIEKHVAMFAPAYSRQTLKTLSKLAAELRAKNEVSVSADWLAELLGTYTKGKLREYGVPEIEALVSGCLDCNYKDQVHLDEVLVHLKNYHYATGVQLKRRQIQAASVEEGWLGWMRGSIQKAGSWLIWDDSPFSNVAIAETLMPWWKAKEADRAWHGDADTYKTYEMVELHDVIVCDDAKAVRRSGDAARLLQDSV